MRKLTLIILLYFPLGSYTGIQMIPRASREASKELTMKVRATYYNAVPSQGCDDAGGTAFGLKINKEHASEQRIIAISRDLLQMGFKPLDSVIIKGAGKFDGKWILGDKMSKYKNKHLPRRYWKKIERSLDLLLTVGHKFPYLKDSISITKILR